MSDDELVKSMYLFWGATRLALSRRKWAFCISTRVSQLLYQSSDAPLRYTYNSKCLALFACLDDLNSYDIKVILIRYP